MKPLLNELRHNPLLWLLVLVPAFITSSGRSAWFPGALLLLVYAVFAMSLYVLLPQAQ